MGKKLSWVFVLMFGCSGGGGGGGGDIEIEQLGEELGAAVCPHIFDCCTPEERAQQFSGFGGSVGDNLEECEQFYNGLANAFLIPGLRDSIEAGRAAFHPDRAGACMNVISAQSCEDYSASLSEGDELLGGACEDPIEALVDEGGTCTQDYECTTGFCSGAQINPDGSGEDGSCSTVPGPGDACDFECSEGYYCETDSETFERVCIETQDDGADCFTPDACSSGFCDDEDQQDNEPGVCASAAVCDGQ